MSMSIGSFSQASAAPSAAQVSTAIATTSLAQTKERGREAVDLIKSAMAPGSGRLLDTYA